jgi:hypothetical protein
MSSLHLLSIFYLVNVMVEVEAIKMFTDRYKVLSKGEGMLSIGSIW